MQIKRCTAAFAVLLLTASCWAARRRAAVPDELQRARVALFESSDLDTARREARAELQRNPADAEALFIEMEAAALQADTAAELDAALQMLERAPADARAGVAAARVLDLAANSSQFRAVLPRIRQLIAGDTPQSSYLRAALIAAASDGAPGISLLQSARDAGLLTDWRLAGPFGRYANLDFDRSYDPQSEGLGLPVVAGHAVESLQFADGNFTLPEYFGRDGVLYAASTAEVPRAGNWYLRVESPGTIEVFVDGVSRVRKDDRFQASSEIAWRAIRLSAGEHRVLVKFLASAAPFRVAVLPAHAAQPQRSQPPIAYAPEAAYLAAAQKFWDGDTSGALEALQPLHGALADFLAANSWAHESENSAEGTNRLRSVVRLAPSAAAAEFELASTAFAAGRNDEAVRALKHVLAERPSFAPAQELMAEMAQKLNWRDAVETAFDAELRLHPSCQALQNADKFFAAQDQFERAAEVEAQLQGCAPGSTSYLEALAAQGRHGDAAQAAAALVAAHPLDRGAREWLVRELALSGDTSAAQKAARELAAVAPNSARYASVASAEDPAAVLDDASAADLAEANPFYQPWRRDGVGMAVQTFKRKFSGGPAVTLLDDSVARLNDDDSISLYVHTVTRVLNRDGIERYGEAEIPQGAELLELRTIKPDGSVAEPELTQNKTTISMPGLAPEDAIDVEYVVRLEGGVTAHPETFSHTFGSFKAPILYSRFVVLTKQPLQIESEGDAPAVAEESWNGLRAMVWEQDDIPQSLSEVALPQAEVQPSVRVLPVLERGWAEVRDRYRDQMVDAARIGSRVRQTAQQITRSAANSSQETTARALYRWVMTNLRDSNTGIGDAPAAEDTLAARSGDRTIVLLALARAAGLDADLLLARNPGTQQPRAAAIDAYTRPLALFHLPGRDLAVDAEVDGLGFGALSPGVETADALLVPLASEHPSAAEVAELQQPDIVPVPVSTAISEQSVASADVRVESNGDLSADVHIVLGSWRASQMRSILDATEPGQRGDFFLQMAARIFPGTTQATGEVKHERDTDHALEIDLHCRAPQFVNLSGQTADLDQFVPTLGLKKMYATGSERKFPLFVDTPLFETATFRVHLPEGTRMMHLAADAQLRSEFGRYSVSFRQVQPGVVEIRRDFRIPVQVVPEQKIGAFRSFAAQIDNAERQRMTVGTFQSTAAARQPAAAQ
ncbi:MAG TPA: DUF3857 domain-containing protein [Terriglobales bacterium]|nr:DUF3857 domain-containing protein [Terriglobales bacterium]